MQFSFFSKKSKNWAIFFILKINIIIFGIFLVFESLLQNEFKFLYVSIPLIFIGGFFIYQDVKSDPHELIKLFKFQMLLWWRLQGPLIYRKPYIFHFPEKTFLRNKDIIKTISLSKIHLLNGKEIIKTIKSVKICPICKGRRNEPLSVHIECSNCQKGYQKYYFKTLNGLSLNLPCNHCLGVGWVPIETCSKCKGKGAIWVKQKVKITIPTKSKAGTYLRIPNRGKFDPKDLNQGDFYFKIRNKYLNIF